MAKRRYTNEEVEQWRRDHKKALYSNPDDSRLWVRKASGFGYIPNMGNPLAWVMVIVIIAVIVSLVTLRIVLRHTAGT